jgi:hypothetical protein
MYFTPLTAHLKMYETQNIAFSNYSVEDKLYFKPRYYRVKNSSFRYIVAFLSNFLK